MGLFKEIRGDVIVPIAVPYMAAGGTGGASYVVPYNATITAAKLVWSAAITGVATNNFAISFFNRGGGGAGTVQWGTAVTYASGTNASKAVASVVTLSSTASDLLPAAGDVLNVELSTNGTGLICPGGAVMLTLRWR